MPENGVIYAGGLCGYNQQDSGISCCYSTESVTYVLEWPYDCVYMETYIADRRISGLVGRNAGSINYCYWDRERSGISTSEGGTGKTTAEMLDIETYLPEWDFEIVWWMPENDYPDLHCIGWPSHEPPPEPPKELSLRRLLVSIYLRVPMIDPAQFEESDNALRVLVETYNANVHQLQLYTEALAAVMQENSDIFALNLKPVYLKRADYSLRDAADAHNDTIRLLVSYCGTLVKVLNKHLAIIVKPPFLQLAEYDLQKLVNAHNQNMRQLSEFTLSVSRAFLRGLRPQ